MISSSDWVSLFVTLRLAAISTVVLLILGTPLAWWLSQTRKKIRPAIEALVALPLILPPTVLGFYLLIGIGASGPFEPVIGNQAFSFTGLVIGSVIYSLPFVVQPLQNSFRSIKKEYLESATILNATGIDRFFSIVFPLTRSGFVTAAVLAFAHTIGEFGVVLMIGGNLPGETKVLSISIYEHVEAMNYTSAHSLSAGLLVFSFFALLLLYRKGVSRK